MVDKQIAESARRSGIIGGVVVATAGLLAALALVYSNAAGVAQVAEDARHQQQAESALGAAASAHNALGQTLLIAASTEDQGAVEAATAETRLVLDAMKNRVLTVADTIAEPTELEQDLAAVLLNANLILDAMAEGNVDGAWDLATGASAESFARLVTGITAHRDDIAASIISAAAKSGSVATASRFMVAFFVPSLAVLIAFVVSKRRRKREMLAIELEQERGLNRSKDQLIANLSHELRTPLTGIYTTALAAEDAGFDDVELTRELNGLIIDQSADLNRMVEDLLATAQAEAGRLQFDLVSTDVEPLVDNLAKEFDRFDAQIRIELESGSVLADPGRLRQLLRNLISNAAKYGNGQVTLDGKVTGASYVIDVIDDGAGVPPDVAERMFERFVHRGSQPLIAGSVGLGLSISKVLAEGMGGEVAYRRSDGQTIFEVTLQEVKARQPAGSQNNIEVVESASQEKDTAVTAEVSHESGETEPPTIEKLPPDPLPMVGPELGVNDDRQPPRFDLTDVAVSNRIRRTLAAAGVTSLDDLLALSTQDLLAIRGIGSASVEAIESALLTHGVAAAV